MKLSTFVRKLKSQFITGRDYYLCYSANTLRRELVAKTKSEKLRNGYESHCEAVKAEIKRKIEGEQTVMRFLVSKWLPFSPEACERFRLALLEDLIDWATELEKPKTKNS